MLDLEGNNFLPLLVVHRARGCQALVPMKEMSAMKMKLKIFLMMTRHLQKKSLVPRKKQSN